MVVLTAVKKACATVDLMDSSVAVLTVVKWVDVRAVPKAALKETTQAENWAGLKVEMLAVVKVVWKAVKWA